jgi:CHAT domain-containing protein/tetratricopeptide (TPR) repeat protein
MSRPLYLANLSIVLLLVVSVTKTDAQPSAQREAPTVSLELGKPIERSIEQEKTHSYTLNLSSGQYAHVLVEQRRVNVLVAIYGPDGAKLVQVDSPNYNYGLEPVSLVVDTSGPYRLEVKSQSTNATGRYEVRLDQLRLATQQDRNRFAAQKLCEEARALRSQQTQESFQQAADKFQAALSVWRTAGDKLMQAYMFHEIAIIYGDIGQYQKALDAHAKASILYKDLKLPRDEARALNNTAWIYGELGDNQKSLETYDRVAEIYRTVGNVDPKLLSNIGSSYAKLGDYRRALEIHLRVLEMRRASGDAQEITLSNIGNCYDHLGEKSKAIDFYSKALELMRQAGDHFYTATTLTHIGVFYRGSGEYEKALNYLNEALTLRKTIGDQKGIATTLFQIARLERDRGNVVEARKRIEAALALVESLRTKVASQQLRASFFASVQQYREFYIDLLLRLHKDNPSQQLDRAAFNASETGRARSLLELLREASAEIRHGVDPALLERHRSLGQLIAEKADSQMRLLSGKHTEEQATAALNEITQLTTEYEQVEAQIRHTSPQYAALIQPVPLKLEETQQRVLDADTLLLEYSLGEEKSFLWAVTPESLKTYELPKRAIIEPLARRVYELLIARNQNVVNETLEQRRRRLELAEAEYPKAAASLSQMLLGPAAAELKNKRLLIVSDGVLQFIPFAGLPHPRGSRPLSVDHEIVTAPSASVLALLRQETANRKPATKTLAVFADPVFSTNDPRVAMARLAHAVPEKKTDVARSASESGLGDLRRLRFSRQEADEITRFANDELKLEATDFNASRTLATSGELKQYRIIHFATHGLINNQHPELSGIVLSLVDEQGRQQNGFLRLYDLYNLKLSAELVVLSACQTALGKEIRGEGLVGLTRGFMYAGAPRVIASLWQIDDRASAEFMKRFYQGLLGQKLRPAAALRLAQVSMQNDKRWSAPHYWAAFTLQGEWK